MVTKILVSIIVILILLNAAMIFTVCATSPPDSLFQKETEASTDATSLGNPIIVTSHTECNNSVEIPVIHTEPPTACTHDVSLNDTDVEECADETQIDILDDSLLVEEIEDEGVSEDSSEICEEPLSPAMCLDLTFEEKDMLLRIAMAEVGGEDCVQCLALVMRTVLNRVESPLFSNTIYGVLHSENQFSPVASGSFYTVVPNEKCQEALDLIMHGWDESQGALYFEACIGSSWHSRNCELLFQHCSTRFYR